MRSKNFVQTIWVQSNLLFKHFWCKASLLFNHSGCKARHLFKHLCAKQDFYSIILEECKTFVQTCRCKARLLFKDLECKGRIKLKIWVQREFSVQNILGKNKKQNFCSNICDVNQDPCSNILEWSKLLLKHIEQDFCSIT